MQHKVIASYNVNCHGYKCGKLSMPAQLPHLKCIINFLNKRILVKRINGQLTLEDAP